MDFDIRSARTEVVYAPMYLGDRRVALPQTATTVVEHPTAATGINRVGFSHCRPYSNTSSIRFDDAAPTPTPVRNAQPPIPAGLSLLMRVATPLSERSTVGDRFTLVMEADARSHGDTIIGKGAQVQGRVRWIETTTCPARCLAGAIEPLSVTAFRRNQPSRVCQPAARGSGIESQAQCVEGHRNPDRTAFRTADAGHLCADTRPDHTARLADDLAHREAALPMTSAFRLPAPGFRSSASTNAWTSRASTPGATPRLGPAVADARCTTVIRTGPCLPIAWRRDSMGSAMRGMTVLDALHSAIHSPPSLAGKRKSTSSPC